MTPAWQNCLLFTETHHRGADGAGWRFLVHMIDSGETVSASDQEPGMRGDRLALMAVVRGLEALEQPSIVKLMSSSAYVRRGVTRGIEDWRANDWKWERFGRLTPVRDQDLWQRVDRAMTFHRVSCRGWQPSAQDNSTPAISTPRRRALPTTPVERVIDGVINEPALLIVRGRRRHVLPIQSNPVPASNEANPESLAAAG